MKDLLFLSTVRWDTIWQRPQHLAMGLSRYFRIIYVDPVAYSFLGAVQNHLRGDRTRNFRPTLREINDNLVAYTPAPMFPFSEDFWFINEINHNILWVALSKLLVKKGYKDPVLFINSPYQLPILKRLLRSSGCYDCMDLYEAFYKPESRRRRIIIQKEEEILSKTRVVFASSEKLVQHVSARNKNVHLVQNGVTELFLNYEKGSHTTPPPDFPPGDGPVIGYIGAISNWFDVNAIRVLAESHPSWRFVLLGPVGKKGNLVKNSANVHFLGVKGYSLLPAYVEQFDIATIPFELNDLTKAVNPVKVYEYFALGKTVVATRLPELTKFEDVCYLADSSSDFVSKVETAILDLQNSDQPALARVGASRRNIAINNAWQKRVESIYSVICIEYGLDYLKNVSNIRYDCEL